MRRPGKAKPGRAAVEALFASALSLHAAGSVDRACALYRKILAIAPGHAGALHLLGVAALDSGDLQQAERLITRALGVRPGYPEAHFDLGRTLLALGRTEEGTGHLERAAALDSGYAEPRQALGLAHLESGRPDLALEWLDQALALAPDNPDAWLQRSWTLQFLRRPEEAIAACARAVELAPNLLQARLELADALIKSGRLQEAAVQLDAAQATDPASAWEASLRGQAALAAGDLVAAEADFRRSLELDPGDPHGVAARLAAIGAEPTPERSSLAWVRRVYEGKARLWDQSMEAERGYRAPLLLARALEGILSRRAGLDVLDAGCGSGLCAPMLRPLARRLDGVDISPAMLDVARGKDVYDRLEEAELTEFLAGAPSGYELIVAAAVLIYLGDLGPVLRAAFAALRPGGVFAFTFFPGDEPGFGLTSTGHYHHHPAYVRDQARQAGFELAAWVEGEHEYQDDQPVPGVAVALVKPVP